jgi:hypothetical protein
VMVEPPARCDRTRPRHDARLTCPTPAAISCGCRRRACPDGGGRGGRSHRLCGRGSRSSYEYAGRSDIARPRPVVGRCGASTSTPPPPTVSIAPAP